MKKIIIFLFSIILFSSCCKFYYEDLADKFVGEYICSEIVYDDNDVIEYENSEIIYISKIDYNTVYISKFNKDARIYDYNKIIIDDFHTYEDTHYIEYKFEPGIYVNGLFTIKCYGIDNNGYKKEYFCITLVFKKIN